MELGSDAEERKQSVVRRGEVTPEIAEAIPPRRDLLLELLLGEPVEEGRDPVGVELPGANTRVDEPLLNAHLHMFHRRCSHWGDLRSECCHIARCFVL